VLFIQSLLAKSQSFNSWQSIEKKSALMKLSAILLKSYESVANHSDSNGCDSTNSSVNIIYQQVTGLPIDNINCFHSTIIMDLPSSFLNGHNLFRPVNFRRTDLVVAIFESSIELPNSTKHFNTIEITSENSMGSISLEKTFLNSMAEMIQRSKIDVVCCQQRIHPFLKRKLLTMGIRTLSNISVRYIGALLRLTVLFRFFI